MARNKSIALIQLEYYSVLGLWKTLRRLPISGARGLSRTVLNGIVKVMPKRRELMLRNIQFCFPEKSTAECRAIADASLETLAKSIVFFNRLQSLNMAKPEPTLRARGLEYIDEARRAGKGVLMATAHYGCWEVLAPYLMHRYPGSSAIARPLDNPKLDALITQVREHGGGKMTPKDDLFRQSLRILKKNGVMGIVMDQNFNPGGVFVEFFGRLAATTPIMPVVAQRTGATIVPVRARWENDGLVIACDPPLQSSQNPDASQAVAEDTAKLTRHIEGWIREDPTQWLWLHNRWKRRPRPGEQAYTVARGAFTITTEE